MKKQDIGARSYLTSRVNEARTRLHLNFRVSILGTMDSIMADGNRCSVRFNQPCYSVDYRNAVLLTAKRYL